MSGHLFCPRCGRAHDQHQWASLALHGYAGAFKAGGTWRAVELRVCVCTAVIGTEVQLPMATGVPTTPKPALSAVG
jgi:hypothetical protein